MGEQEAALIARARDGDLEAFAEFVRLFQPRVRVVLGRLLDDERDVDEAVQDTFVQAWRALPRFRGHATPFTWLYRIATNEALQRRRRKRPASVSFDELAQLDDETLARAVGRPVPADVEAESRLVQDFLVSRLRALPFELRAPLVLRDIEGWSYREVAAALRLSVSGTKRRVHRARMLLCNDLELWLEGRGRKD